MILPPSFVFNNGYLKPIVNSSFLNHCYQLWLQCLLNLSHQILYFLMRMCFLILTTYIKPLYTYAQPLFLLTLLVHLKQTIQYQKALIIYIKLQDSLATKYEPFPYSVMMIDKVGQALTLSKLIEALIFDKIQFTNSTFILSTLIMSQVPIVVLFIGLRDYHSTLASYSKVKELALENSIIYLITSLVFLFFQNTNLVKLDTQPQQLLSIIQFVLYSTIYYQVKKVVKSRNQSKIKSE